MTEDKSLYEWNDKARENDSEVEHCLAGERNGGNGNSIQHNTNLEPYVAKLTEPVFGEHHDFFPLLFFVDVTSFIQLFFVGAYSGLNSEQPFFQFLRWAARKNVVI